MEVLYTPIAIDLITPHPLPILKAKQGDTGRGALITITAGKVWTLTDEAVRIFVRKPDGHIVYADCAIVDGKAQAEFKYQMVAAAGRAELEIEIDDGTHRISTPIAILQVMPSNISDAADPSTSEAPALVGLIGIASTEAAGLVKVDGETITADDDGTLRVIGGGSGGGPGEDGGYYTPEISQTEEQAAAGIMTVSYAASKDGMELVAAQTVQLPAGAAGKDGVAKIVTVSIPTSGWSNNQQTFTATGITAGSPVIFYLASAGDTATEAEMTAAALITNIVASAANKVTVTVSAVPATAFNIGIMVMG